MDVPGAQLQQQQQARGNISYFLFLSMLFFFLNSSGPDLSGESTLRSVLARLTTERDQYKEWLFPGSTLHDDPPLTATSIQASPSSAPAGNTTVPVDGSQNITSFVLQDQTPPKTIADKVDRLLETQSPHGNYYRNISGFFTGDYAVHTGYNLTLPSQAEYNATEAERRRGHFPWQGESARKKGGKLVKLNVKESVPHVKGADEDKEIRDADIAIFRGTMDLELYEMRRPDSEGGFVETETRTTELDMEGVHFLNNGSFFIHAGPLWMDLDMRQLPGLISSNHTRNETAQVILKELDARIERVKHNLAIGKYPDGTASEGDVTMNCSFSMYGQLRPLPPEYSRKQIAEYESELHEPTGRTVANLPASRMDAIIFSRDCNLVLELDNMEGLERDLFWEKAITYAAVLSISTILQTWVLVRQMEYTSTPTAIGKVAHLTIAMQVIMDVYFSVTHLTLGIVTANRASSALLIPGFFGLLCGLLFGLRYAATIRVTTYRPTTVTPPPPPPAAPAQPASAEGQTRRSTEIPNTTTPLLARVDRGPQAVADWDAQEQAETRKKLAAFFTVAFTVIVCFAYFGWFPIILTVAYSFWLPQIYQNAERGTGRLPLLHSYILTTTASRLVIPLYVWACPTNLLFSENTPWVWALVAWQLTQFAVLLLQDTFGPRFFLPKGFWFAELDTWDYHPILPPQDIENPSNTDGEGVDCVICFEKIELANSGRRDSIDARTSEKGEEGAGASGAVGDVLGAARRGASRMSYMVPPCHHLAHTSCLESWAAIKMECPLCRRPLPPF